MCFFFRFVLYVVRLLLMLLLVNDDLEGLALLDTKGNGEGEEGGDVAGLMALLVVCVHALA